MKNLSERSTDELRGIIARVTAAMLRHLELPEEGIVEFTEQVKERKNEHQIMISRVKAEKYVQRITREKCHNRQ